jgi:hypothetical protein
MAPIVFIAAPIDFMASIRSLTTPDAPLWAFMSELTEKVTIAANSMSTLHAFAPEKFNVNIL